MTDRNSWATPVWLTDLLPEVDLDPCSNSNSTVRAHRTYDLTRGEDGLVLPWSGVMYVNPPFDHILPWAEKYERDRAGIEAIGFLVNADGSTRWWRALTKHLGVCLMFHRRIQFTPPAGIKPSTNSKPQALLCDHDFLMRCDARILRHASVWNAANPSSGQRAAEVTP